MTAEAKKQQDFKKLARWLARDLAAIVEKYRPDLIIGDGDYDAMFERAEKTLEIYRTYLAGVQR